MNYIRQLNAFFHHINLENRLTSGHVALYYAFFHYWNLNRFKTPIAVVREDIMKLSRIGSKNTYHKYLKELQLFGFLIYEPGNRKFSKCKVHLKILYSENTSINFTTCSDPILTSAGTSFDTGTIPDLIPLIKQNINNINSVSPQVHNKNNYKVLNKPTLKIVQSFFKLNHYPLDEAQKFYHYNEGMGWAIAGKTIQNWHSFAHKWMLNTIKNSNKISSNIKNKTNDPNTYLHIPTDQKYSEPF